MTDAEYLKCVEVLDEVKSRGGDTRSLQLVDEDSLKSKGSIEPFDLGQSAEKTAELVGGSREKVKRTRKVLKDPKKAEEARP